MRFSKNEVVLLPIPFTDLTSRKVRPAVVVGCRGVDLFLVPITSQLANRDFPLKHWQAAGLNVPCGIKAQIATVEAGLVIKSVGRLSSVDQQMLNDRLRAWLEI
jgi:mRNA interferase MazF